MNLHNSKCIESAQYYIWWLMHCSQNVNIEQIKNEVTALFVQLNTIGLETDYFCPELSILEEIRLLNCNISLYKSFKELEDLMDEEWSEQCREEILEQYREEFREEYRNYYRQKQYGY